MRSQRSALALLLCAATGCATTTALAPAALLPVAGMPEDAQAELPTADGDRKVVSGSTEVWLHASNGVVYDVPLATLKKDGNALLLPPDGFRYETEGAPNAIIKGHSVGKTIALVGIITGGVLVTLLIVGLAASAGRGSASSSPP
jgi:hypothetical protein